MTPEDFEQRQYQLSIQAGMNQRYHQAYSHCWLCWDRLLRITVGIVAFAGAIITVVAAMRAGAWDGVSIGFAIVAAVLAITLNVIPLGDWIGEHRDLFRRWTDLREEIDDVLFDYAGAANEELVERLRQLEARAQRICGAEPAANDQFLRACYREERWSREPSPSVEVGAT